jgi:hypothetical protein
MKKGLRFPNRELYFFSISTEEVEKGIVRTQRVWKLASFTLSSFSLCCQLLRREREREKDNKASIKIGITTRRG